MRKILLLVCTLLVAPVEASPGELLDAYYEAIATDDFSGMGKIMLPAEVREVKRIMLEVAASNSPAAKSMESRFFGDDVTSEEAEAKSGEFYVEQLLGLLNAEAGMMSFSIDQRKIVGEVKEDDDQRHILVRTEVSLGKATRSTLSIFSFTKVKDQWYMQYPTVLRAYLDLIEQDMALYR